MAHPNPRQAAVIARETGLQKALSGGGQHGQLKPFTPETRESMRGILMKAVADKEIDLVTSSRYEYEINQSVLGKGSNFSNDFVEFMRRSVEAPKR